MLLSQQAQLVRLDERRAVVQVAGNWMAMVQSRLPLLETAVTNALGSPRQRWEAIPHGQASAAFGGHWLRTGQQLGLVLPSVVVPQARNLLLNPLHPAMDQVALVHLEPFQLDHRLG